MPIKHAAEKYLRKSQKNLVRNEAKRTALKRLIKDVRKLVAAKKNAEAEKMLPELYQLLDKAAKANLIKKNTAARKKSRLTKFVRAK